MNSSGVSLENFSLDTFPAWLVVSVLSCATLLYAGLWAVICLFLTRNLDAIPGPRRRIGKGAVWLLVIPLFNAWWLFRVTSRLSASWRGHLTALGHPSPGGCAQTPGLWWAIVNAICTVTQFIPNLAAQIIALVGSLAFLVLLVVYLILLNDLRLKATSPVPAA